VCIAPPPLQAAASRAPALFFGLCLSPRAPATGFFVNKPTTPTTPKINDNNHKKKQKRGGREGYTTLLNTDMGMELDNLASFLKLAVDYKKRIGARCFCVCVLGAGGRV
jgi:hypothetical protein